MILYKHIPKPIIFVTVFLLAVATLSAVVVWRTYGRTVLEFDIEQDTDLILFSEFGEPPQFAIWLENAVSGETRTIFVTHRAATGDWEGKSECPDALPYWFALYKGEFKREGLPSLKESAPAAITGATPKLDHFKIAADVEPGTKWICWIEINLAADFNQNYQRLNELTGVIDPHMSGQPALLYRGVIDAVVGQQIEPELYGQSKPDRPKDQIIQPLTDDITTARRIFKKIVIRAIRPKPRFIPKTVPSS
jgi:hypothetical protein